MIDTVVQLPFAERTYVILAMARGIAASQGHDSLRPEHVALAIIRESESPAAVAMRIVGASLPSIRAALEEALPEAGRPKFREVDLPCSAFEAQLVGHAEVEAVKLGHRWIGAEHLLLALVRDAQAPVATLMAQHGVTHAPVESAVVSMIRPHIRSRQS